MRTVEDKNQNRGLQALSSAAVFGVYSLPLLCGEVIKKKEKGRNLGSRTWVENPVSSTCFSLCLFICKVRVPINGRGVFCTFLPRVC